MLLDQQSMGLEAMWSSPIARVLEKVGRCTTSPVSD